MTDDEAHITISDKLINLVDELAVDGWLNSALTEPLAPIVVDKRTIRVSLEHF